MSIPPVETALCGQCGTQVPPRLLSCPGCGRLLHADKLKALASEAETAEQKEDFPGALAAWRSALELLPAGTRQQQLIVARIDELGRKTPAASVTVRASPEAARGKVRTGGLAGLGALGLLIWKFKFIALFV
ncbi:MAG TPA: zinc ribbon domain-containing protein, partial [Gemmataceae bacterium]|nr:zinc ribbon domain-containing protein [Gemmataceae bacterium]